MTRDTMATIPTVEQDVLFLGSTRIPVPGLVASDTAARYSHTFEDGRIVAEEVLDIHRVDDTRSPLSHIDRKPVATATRPFIHEPSTFLPSETAPLYARERGATKLGVLVTAVAVVGAGVLAGWKFDVIDRVFGDKDSDKVETTGRFVNVPVIPRLEQGDKPCGRVVTQPELQAHFAANPNIPVTNPAEANSFMNEHPNLKSSMLGFYDQNYGGMIDWVNGNKSKTNDNLVDPAGDRMAGFYNRLKVVQLTSAITVDNHNCDVNSGQITDLGPQTLQSGDFVYGFDLKSTKQLNRFLHQSGLNREDVILASVNIDGKNKWFVIVNRSTCNNPLTPVKPDIPRQPTTTTTTTLANKHPERDQQNNQGSPNAAPGLGGSAGSEGTLGTTTTLATTATTITVPGAGTPSDPAGACGEACE